MTRKVPVLSFTVPGDPVPYLRMTQGQIRLMRIPDSSLSSKALAVKGRIRRYLAYKDLVAWQARGLEFDRRPKFKTYLHVMIYFRDRKHPDAENVRKGIQDALFKQDKYVAGSFDFGYDPKRPRCEVKIVFDPLGEETLYEKAD